MKIVFASNNQNKLSELNALINKRPLLKQTPVNLSLKKSARMTHPSATIELISQSFYGVTEVEESGLTFVENALIKARHASQITGLPTIADDSGLVVPILNNAPGIYSARYAGDNATAEDNIEKLLNNLKNVPSRQRNAYFYCVLVCILHEHDPIPLICEGKWQGSIACQLKGKQGFGYDPIFYIPAKKRTAAQLSPIIKNKISHRGIALQLLMKRLAEKL
ncbi:MAG: non-canonical purine NTP pyrophosphatase, RdgB/HAM1 family [Gammaproteobacteria bacterium RIFCSPHIGHO2_12_FULL_37_14]|nr:MAG: non-canonical purine NTP pyrophosphatase, RdgB/HAM1 family [Gammaproteobacteria bacterium RIFCSPHIGHO2_12_FULL_37_14]